MSLTAAEIDAAYQPTLTRAKVCLDATIALQIGRLEEELATEKRVDDRTNRTPVAPEIAARILELKDKAEQSEAEFVFRGIGRRAYTDMLKAHPPTPQQEAEAKERGEVLTWNPDTFPPALMAAACVQPEGTDLAWWNRRYDEWTVGQLERLFRAAVVAQGGVVEVPKALSASALMSDSAPKLN